MKKKFIVVVSESYFHRTMIFDIGKQQQTSSMIYGQGKKQEREKRIKKTTPIPHAHWLAQEETHFKLYSGKLSCI